MQQKHKPDSVVRPLCVDLDGTLIRSDSLAELFFALIGKNVFYCFFIPLWLLRGKAFLKQQIAKRVEIDPSHLPYNEKFLDHLRAEKKAGRRLILATAADTRVAKSIADHLKLFDTVFASDGVTNLSRDRKAVRLVEEFGAGGFDYAGNSKGDLPVWRSAQNAIVVNPNSGVQSAAASVADVSHVIDDRKGRIGELAKAMRLHQWVKNLLVFTPVFLAHEITAPGLLLQAFWAFCAFSFCASSVYILNDLLDIAADRKHRTKCRRPFATGRLSVVFGSALIPLMLVISLGFASLLPAAFLAILGLYCAISLAYSFLLKRVQFVDVLVLAGLYTIRIKAGGAATGLELSFWLISFSMFFFLSLALAKRYVELLTIQGQGSGNSYGRSYAAVDLETLAHFGVTSGYISILVLALYVNSENVKALYNNPEIIWLVCPVVLYFISRVWLKARSGDLHDDPVVFAIRDRQSLFAALLAGLLLWIAAMVPL